MEQRRLLLFITLSMAILIGWNAFFAPKRIDKPKPQNVAAQDDEPVIAPLPLPAEAELAENPDEFVPLPLRTVTLGSLDPATGYFLQADLTTRGAAVDSVRLNDPRYRELGKAGGPLKIIGATEPEVRTLETEFAAVDAQLSKHNVNLRSTNWEVVEEIRDAALTGADGAPVLKGVVFGFRAPDGSLELRKKYELRRVEGDAAQLREAREDNPAGYELFFTISAKNLSRRNIPVAYSLIGPTGMPLENLENTRKYRDVEIGFLSGPGDIDEATLDAASIVDQAAEEKLEQWKQPLQYIGVEIQYFAALLLPQENQLENQTIESARPFLVDKADAVPAQSDITVQLTSKTVELGPGATLEHSYALYAGPKRQTLLEPLGASTVLDFGWTAFVSRPMLLLLDFLSDLGVGYGIGIILLTVIVRACMFPVSRKQAVSAKRMKELQPRIMELRKKYAGDKEKLARAQLELYAKHKINPLGGCLPLLIQLPIFIGLYQALMNSVDLRLAEFLWIDNLAAPDRLFELPFRIPYLGDDFNLLPLITVLLFYIQQKMFMPPPASEEQELQYKMMNFMMLFMGVLFYHVPAGLCVYFIASSLWGIGERKMLDYTGVPATSAGAGPDAGDGPDDDNRGGGSGGGGPRRPSLKKDDKLQPQKSEGFFARLMAAANEAAAEAQERAKSGTTKRDSNDRSKGSKKSKSRR